ncbi:hypothetical protein LOZ66_004266 [Ophidiomyces ophidiicola]|nr:hypothetical protein LOZ66_004266 [Ophidiomyces ophidiicola]
MDRPRHSPESSSHPRHPALFASLQRTPRVPEAAGADASKDSREKASREAKRYLLQVVRNDWTYETTPRSPALPSPLSSSSDEEPPPPPLPKDREVLEWRLREEDTSGSEQEVEKDAGQDASDPYRFESPDAVEQAVLERRRKRRKLIEDEMQWNRGLRIWTHRRDAWTGARAISKPSAQREAQTASKPWASSDESAGGSTNGASDLETVESISRVISADSAPSATTASKGESSAPPGDAISRSTIVVPQTEPLADSPEPLVPVVPPILPDCNPFRAYTTPANYPAIYNKLVVEGNTPAVPVNLSHMTRALVQGWKKEGQWPPKPTLAQNVPVVRKRRSRLHRESSSKAVATTVGGDDSGSRRRSIGSNVTGAVKKVLGFATMHPGHRFHIRGSSQSGAPSAGPPA